MQGTLVGNHRRAAALLLVCAAAGALVYFTAFAAAFPLLARYDQPLLDLGKLTDHSFEGALRFVLAFTLLFALYALGYRLLRNGVAGSRASRWIVLGAPLVFASALILTYPVGAADVYDYSFHSRMLGFYGVNPIVHVPAEFASDPWYFYVAWPYAASPYGPLWQMTGLLVYTLAGGDLLATVLGFKLVAVAALAADAALVYALLRQWRPEAALAGFYFVAWNPLLLFESAANAHNDTLMATFVLIGLWLYQRRHSTAALLAIFMAASIKVPALVALPIVAVAGLQLERTLGDRVRWLLRSALALAFGAALLYLPFAAGNPLDGIVAHQGLLTTSPATLVDFLLRPGLDEPLARYLAEGAGLACFVAGIALLLWKTQSAPSQTARSTFDVLLLLLLCATFWFQPWYLAWIVPLAPLASPKRLSIAALMSWSVLGVYFVFEYLLVWTVEIALRDGGFLVNVCAVAIVFGPPLALAAWQAGGRATHLLRRVPAKSPARTQSALGDM